MEVLVAAAQVPDLSKEEAIRRLRALGQPATLFGEVCLRCPQIQLLGMVAVLGFRTGISYPRARRCG